MDSSLYFVLGFTAQALFSARMLVQWLLSEKSKKVVSPLIYWQLSLFASFLFFIYGWLRTDFAILLGQLFSYYIYIWNLNIQQYWKKINPFFRFFILIMPVIGIGLLLSTGKAAIERLWTDVSFGLLLFGSFGQLIFTFRFVYQWWYSRKLGESVLPAGFWILSLVGSFCIIIYGVYRLDPVLIVGQGVGFFTYARNLIINGKNVYETKRIR